MDPVSATLAAITLATAIKDIVELAERIESSFAKVSQNLRNAQFLVTEIRETLYQLKEFSEQHYDVLNTTNETENAVRKLHFKMNSAYETCIQLLPASSNQRIRRLRISLQAWKNREKIEAAISDLKDEVKKCYADFMLFAVMRIEDKLEVMHHTNIQAMENFRTHVCGAPRVSDQIVTVHTEPIPSTSTLPLLRSASNLRDEAISEMYLRIQIDSIANGLTRLSSMDLSYALEKAGCYSRPLHALNSALLPADPTHYFHPGELEDPHRFIVARSITILNILENEPTEISIQEGACNLHNLALGLSNLNMHKEAATMEQWAVKLFRTLVSVNKETYTPHLIHSLKKLSGFYNKINNLGGAFLAIEEATNLCRVLQTPNTPIWLRINYGAILTTYAGAVSVTHKNNVRAIELAEEAVKLFEGILEINTIPYEPCTKVDGIIEVNQDFLTHLLHNSGASQEAICHYAHALDRLSKCLDTNGQAQESLDAKLKALPIFRAIPTMYPNFTMDVEIAGVLFDLISQKSKSILPPGRLLGYAEDCITICRKHPFNDPSLYGRWICRTLWKKANILKGMMRYNEALEVWMELVDLSKKLIKEQIYVAKVLNEVSRTFRQLQRYDEAATMRTQSIMTYQPLAKTNSGTQANRYYDLSVDLHYAGRFQEAVQAAQNAVTQYRAVVFEDPDRRTKDIGRALTELANSYLSVGQCDNALDEGYEVMQIFEKLISKDPTAIDSYKHCLRVNLDVASASENESRAVERVKDIIRHLCALVADYPEEVAFRIWRAEVELGRNLDRFNRIPEARSHFEQLLVKLEDKCRYTGEADIVCLYMRTLIAYARILEDQGYPELALVPLLKAIEISTPLSAGDENIATQTVSAMSRRAHLLCELGCYADSLEVGLNTLEYACTMKLGSVREIVGSLHVVASAALRNCKPEVALEVAQEAVNISRGPAMQEYIKTVPNGELWLLTGSWSALIRLPNSLEFLVRGLADCGKAADGLVYAQAAVEEALKLKSAGRLGRLTWAEVQQMYMSARDCLADSFRENGNSADGLDLLVELREYYGKRAKYRTGTYSDLVRTLRRLGILYCSIGQHEDGITMADELSNLRDQLTSVFPSLSRRIDFDMNGTLQEAHLKCHHQHIFLEGARV